MESYSVHFSLPEGGGQGASDLRAQLGSKLALFVNRGEHRLTTVLGSALIQQPDSARFPIETGRLGSREPLHYSVNVRYGNRSFQGHVAGADFSSHRCSAKAWHRPGVHLGMGPGRRSDRRAACGSVSSEVVQRALFPEGAPKSRTTDDMKAGIRRRVRKRHARH